MSESQMQPGWYYAQGDAPGTQRYWDGSQWVGGPQPVGGAGDVTGGGSSAPVEFGPRAAAWAIDVLPYWVLYIIGYALLVGGDSAGALGGLLIFAGFIYLLWNKGYKMGSSGQSLGKGSQNIKLISDKTGEPIGVGMGFLRLFLSWVFTIPCAIPYILDHLWPLWDGDKKRLLDKILSSSVVQAD